MIRPLEKVAMATEAGRRKPQRQRRFDMHALWRLTGWGVAAAFSLGALALTSQTEIGSQRLKLAFTPAELPVRPVAVVKVPSSTDVEITRLQAQVHELAAERVRLTERVASLEHSLDDLTGSIKRQSEAERAPAAPPPAVSPAPTAPSATTRFKTTPREAERVESNVAARPGALPALSEPIARPEPAAPASAERAEAAPPATPEAAHAHKTVPLPPERMAALPPKPAFGIALAGSSSAALLRMQWAAMKNNFGPLLGDLKPHALAERRGGVLHYRLIVGPLPTYIEAARLCARMIRARAVCHPVRMAGEPL
jgi:septal ring-binding cell division protein DamX